MTPPETPIVLITGASKGIGYGIADVLLQAGYRVVAGFNTHKEPLEALQVKYPETLLPVHINVADLQSVQAAFSSIKQTWGEVLAVVNNAGIAQEKPFLTLTDDDWAAMLNINLIGSVRCIREALPAMQAHGWGRIINIGSIGGQWGGMNQVHYAAAKAGLINLTRSMAKLYAKEGIATNTIAIGLVETDMVANELSRPDGQEKVKGIPAGRLATPNEIGHAVAYLLKDEAGYIVGQTLNMNGGMLFV